MRALITTIIAMGYFLGIGLLTFAVITNNTWVTNIGLPLVLIGAVPIAYQLSRLEGSDGKSQTSERNKMTAFKRHP